MDVSADTTADRIAVPTTAPTPQVAPDRRRERALCRFGVYQNRQVFLDEHGIGAGFFADAATSRPATVGQSAKSHATGTTVWALEDGRIDLMPDVA